jgi:hypothetical protein
MNALFNPFTQKMTHRAMRDLSYNQSITLNEHDSPYYAVLASDITPNPLYGQTLVGYPEAKQDNNYARIAKPVDEDLAKELTFLKGLCLAVEREDSYYINDHAQVLYDPANGFFAKLSSMSDLAILRPNEIATLMILFLKFILPGLYWQTFYAIQRPTAPIYDNTELQAQLHDIEREWLRINKFFTLT